MKELDYAKKNLEKLPIGPLPWPTGPPASVYVPVCDDVHHEVDRNGTGGIFLPITQKWRIWLQSLRPRPLGLSTCSR